MTVDDFRQSLTAAEPPAELTLALTGLWWDAKGDWTRAHESAQQDEGPEGSWVHAYPEVLKAFARFIDGTPKIQPFEAVTSTFHNVAVHATA